MEPDGRASTSSCEKERLEDEPGNHPRAGTHSSTIAQQRQEFLDLYRASSVSCHDSYCVSIHASVHGLP